MFVVDDDISVRESLELLIRFAGWQPETFASAQDSSPVRARPVPSCLVLDVSPAGPQRSRSAEAHRADRSDMPIIFITGLRRRADDGAGDEGRAPSSS